MKSSLFIALAATILLSSCSAPGGSDLDPVRELDLAAEQILKALENYPDESLFPRKVENGEVHLVGARDWTSGFFPGVLWYLYEHTGNEELMDAAHRFSMNLEDMQHYFGDHDQGFRMFCSFGNGYRLTGKPEYREIVLQSSESLLNRYDYGLELIRSWDFNADVWQYPVIIDNMMNLEMLFWVAKETGDPRFYEVANTHAAVTNKNHFRGDGSSYHVISYDTITGEIEKRNTHQGYSHESAWARGQAWGLYGYTVAYRETGNDEYLNRAERIAEFILEHENLPEDGVPYWDYDAPGEENPRDASAAAITASALYELSTFGIITEPMRDYYLDEADRILASLAGSYKIEGVHDHPFILDHSTGSKPENNEVDVPIIYADYYFIEALMRKKALHEE